MNRRDFLTKRIAKTTLAPLTEGGELPAGKKPEELYQNQALPTDLELSASGLSEYTGQWTTKEATHLLRRCCFGFDKAMLDSVVAMGMSAAVNMLLNVSTTPPAPPLNNYNTQNNIDPDVPAGQTWVNAPYSGPFNFRRTQSLRSWWVSQMLTDNTILEKMTLFWHNHFATEVSVYNFSNYAYKHLAMLRADALGNFKKLVKDVTIDPAMLRYLNGNVNTKTAPDENYARELQELFTLGKGPNSKYTEDDVKAAARVLTGWRDSRTGATSFFDPTRHDIGDKQFSSFFGSQVIKGKSGADGANETDELIDMIFNHVEVARYIVRKLYKFFVYYVIDTDIENKIIKPLASIFISNNWEIKPVLDALFKSEHFFDELNMGCVIKSPTDLGIGLMRQFKVDIPSSDLTTQYLLWNYIWAVGSVQQQSLLDPPNVAGWPAYYQAPQYYELWINSDTLPKRNQLTDLMVYIGYKRNGQSMQIDTVAFADQFGADAADPNKLVDHSLTMLYGIGVVQARKDFIKSILLSGQAQDYYWTDIWNDYKSDPNDANKKKMVEDRLKAMYKYLMNLAEYQLS